MKIKKFALGSLWTNCYVVSGDDGFAVVIDPGGPASEVASYIESNGLRVSWILLTHGHGDHIMGLGDVRSLASNGVAIGRGDEECLISARANLSGEFADPAEFEPADKILADGDRLEVGGMAIDVIATPGHTRGGCCFRVTEGGASLLISGDTLFARSIGRSDLPGGDEGVLIESLKKLAPLPDSMMVFPGHGPATTIGEERQLNPFWPR